MLKSLVLFNGKSQIDYPSTSDDEASPEIYMLNFTAQTQTQTQTQF